MCFIDPGERIIKTIPYIIVSRSTGFSREGAIELIIESDKKEHEKYLDQSPDRRNLYCDGISVRYRYNGKIYCAANLKVLDSVVN